MQEPGTEVGIGRLILGIAVWVAVAAFAVVMVATVENVLVGQVAVLAAVFIAWAVGERVVHSDEVK